MLAYPYRKFVREIRSRGRSNEYGRDLFSGYRKLRKPFSRVAVCAHPLDKISSFRVIWVYFVKLSSGGSRYDNNRPSTFRIGIILAAIDNAIIIERVDLNDGAGGVGSQLSCALVGVIVRVENQVHLFLDQKAH